MLFNATVYSSNEAGLKQLELSPPLMMKRQKKIALAPSEGS